MYKSSDKICDLMKKRRLTPEQIAQTDLKGIASKTSIYRGFDKKKNGVRVRDV